MFYYNNIYIKYKVMAQSKQIAKKYRTQISIINYIFLDLKCDLHSNGDCIILIFQSVEGRLVIILL